MEELVNDRLLQDRNQAEPDQESPSPSTSTQSLDTVKRKSPQKSLNVSGPVQPYHPHLKNFWYPVAFSTDLKDGTMVNYSFQSWFIMYMWNTIMERNSTDIANNSIFIATVLLTFYFERGVREPPLWSVCDFNSLWMSSYEFLHHALFQIPIDCFEEPWVLFRGMDGKPGCVQNTCAHRACPLDLGSVNEGRVRCPYHGQWEL